MPELVPSSLFSASKHQATVAALHLTERRDWPSWTGNTLCAVSAQAALLRHCAATDSWADAARAW
eukprot:6590920-Lingulodinium_polyedra.AAC.1